MVEILLVIEDAPSWYFVLMKLQIQHSIML
jgi:hypothetical protein